MRDEGEGGGGLVFEMGKLISALLFISDSRARIYFEIILLYVTA
jgi:hypothetical protein